MTNLFYLALAQAGTPINGGNCGFCVFDSFGGFISSLLPAAFSIAAILLLLYILWAGFKWLSSGGNKEAISSAHAMITHAVIGFGLLVLLFVLFKFIPEFFGANFNIFG